MSKVLISLFTCGRTRSLLCLTLAPRWHALLEEAPQVKHASKSLLTALKCFSSKRYARAISRVFSLTSIFCMQILFGKGHEVGLVLFGTDETNNELNSKQGDYLNVTTFRRMEEPKLDFLRDVEKIKPSKSTRGDWIDGLLVGVDMLYSRIENKKGYNKRVFLITDGESAVRGEDDLPVIVK